MGISLRGGRGRLVTVDSCFGVLMVHMVTLHEIDVFSSVLTRVCYLVRFGQLLCVM